MDINKLPPEDQTASSRRPKDLAPSPPPCPQPCPGPRTRGAEARGGRQHVCGEPAVHGVRARRPSSSQHWSEALPPRAPEHPATESTWPKGRAFRLPARGPGRPGGVGPDPETRTLELLQLSPHRQLSLDLGSQAGDLVTGCSAVGVGAEPRAPLATEAHLESPVNVGGVGATF